jgi:hypothetical protein
VKKSTKEMTKVGQWSMVPVLSAARDISAVGYRVISTSQVQAAQLSLSKRVSSQLGTVGCQLMGTAYAADTTATAVTMPRQRCGRKQAHRCASKLAFLGYLPRAIDRLLRDCAVPFSFPQAERRELQESQRAAKAAAKAQQVWTTRPELMAEQDNRQPPSTLCIPLP